MLNGRDLVIISLRQTIRQRGRYLGVVLSIALGMVGFIVVTAMGRDVKTNINRDLDLLGGATMVKVTYNEDGCRRNPRGFNAAAADEVSRLPGVATVSRVVIKKSPAVTRVGDQRETFSLVGADERFWIANSFEPVSGRFFSAEEVSGRKRVCVLGRVLARRLFGESEATGRAISIERDRYEVIGVLDGVGVGDRNEYAFLPITTAQDRIRDISQPYKLYVRCRTWDDVDPVAAAIPGAIAKCISTEGLEVSIAREQLRHVRRIVWWVELFIYSSIVATLCLGGFGIWNGMMAMVKARTREIALKKAVGADDRDILAQFLMEALCVSVGAALVGVVGAWLVMMYLSRLLQGDLPESVFAFCMGMSLILSVALGIGAGLYPALKASRMEVVSAVRYE